MDDTAKAPKARYATQDRIGVLEELLNERYSVRAFLPREVSRETIEHVLTVAQRTASWCNSQPWQVVIASGEAKERFRKEIYAEAASGAPESGDFPFPREYLGVYLQRRRESGFQLYNTLGIPRGDKAAYARQALENYNFFGAPHVAIIHTDEALGVYGAIDCGDMSAISSWSCGCWDLVRNRWCWSGVGSRFRPQSTAPWKSNAARYHA